MNGYFLDLDGTIIFSHRHFHEGYKPIEIYKEKKISFVERKTLSILEKAIKRGEFIPVTSRTKAQYERIEIFKDNIPQYALLDNGGILLKNGREDALWYEETRLLLTDSLETMNDIATWASQYAEVKIQDEIVIFIKTSDESVRKHIISGLESFKGFYWFIHGEKLYVCSDKLTKGNAVKRLRELIQIDKCFGAGDSEVDFSMIDYVDRFVTDEKNRDMINSEKVIFTHERSVAITALSMN